MQLPGPDEDCGGFDDAAGRLELDASAEEETPDDDDAAAEDAATADEDGSAEDAAAADVDAPAEDGSPNDDEGTSDDGAASDEDTSADDDIAAADEAQDGDDTPAEEDVTADDGGTAEEDRPDDDSAPDDEDDGVVTDDDGGQDVERLPEEEGGALVDAGIEEGDALEPPPVEAAYDEAVAGAEEDGMDEWSGPPELAIIVPDEEWTPDGVPMQCLPLHRASRQSASLEQGKAQLRLAGWQMRPPVQSASVLQASTVMPGTSGHAVAASTTAAKAAGCSRRDIEKKRITPSTPIPVRPPPSQDPAVVGRRPDTVVTGRRWATQRIPPTSSGGACVAIPALSPMRSTPPPKSAYSAILTALACACGPVASVDVEPGARAFHQVRFGEETTSFPDVGLVYGPARADGQRSICSGTLIHADVVLTAAHCVLDADPADTWFTLNAAPPFRWSELLSVSQVRVHPDYDDSALVADVAVLRLKSARTQLEFPPLVDVVVPVETSLTVVGYGIDESGTNAGVRRWGEVTLRAHHVDGTIESAPGASEQTVCPGDSGGPAFAIVDGRLAVVGVASYVTYPYGDTRNECMRVKKAFHTSVYAYRDWIESQSRESRCTVDDAHFMTTDDGCLQIHLGRVWSRMQAPRSWREAVMSCEQLNEGGRSDWRLASMEELRALAFDGGAGHLPGADDDPCWSATETSAGEAATVRISDAAVRSEPGATARPFLCVRLAPTSCNGAGHCPIY